MVHLHRHSEYSRLDGVGTAKEYADRAAELEQPAMALTDHGTMSGALHHIVACRKAGVIPISGVEAYYREDRSIREKEKLDETYHLCVFAKNLKGWHSLLRLTSIAYMEQEDGGGFYGKPCVDQELLFRHREGLIISSGCISSYLSQMILSGNDKKVRSYLKWMLKTFGDDFWFEIQPHDFPEQKLVNAEVVNLAHEFGRPVVAACDAHAPYKDWMKTQQVAKLLSTNSSFKKDVERRKKKAEKEGIEFETMDEGFAKLLPTAYLMDEQEVRDLFAEAHPDIPEHEIDAAIKATHDLAHTTTPFMLDRKDKLPKVSKDEAESERIIKAWCKEGLKRIGKSKDPRYVERYKFEYEILKSKGVLDYFILVGRVVRWAREQGILVNVRGSAAGCLISYLIGIVAIDPIAWGLLFERFINLDRKGLPDIDLDFQHDRRDEVKQFIIEEFGADHVADIISHQTFAPKKVLIDVARVFDINYQEVEALSKTIDIRADDDETTLEEIRTVNETLDKFADKYPEVWEHALRLEGTVANASKHAAGVVISRRPVIADMPTERGKKGDLVTSWSDRADFPAVSDHGFVKIDALGIKGLTKQAVALDLIAKRHGDIIDLDDLGISQDPYDVDEKVMEIFHRGLTLGIWQFGSRGITNLMKQIKPTWGGDLAAGNALYRPGPMGVGVTWEYAELKGMPEMELDFWHPDIKDVLLETYGLIAYQEQVMEICKQLGGFTGGQADDMRKAMGKLYRLPGDAAQRYMAKFKDQWDKGTSERDLTPEVAEDIWQRILSFGGYGFNKSHSASYAVQAYQDAFLKAYYPHEFFCALLHHPPSTAKKKKEDKTRFMQQVVRECEALDVDLSPPDINLSDRKFSLQIPLPKDPADDKLRFGLVDIKDVGDSAGGHILDRRPFSDWDDFMEKMAQKGDVKANSKVRTALIKSGACDRWGMRDENSGSEMGAWEKELLGIAVTMTGVVHEHQALIAESIHSAEEVEELEDGREVICGGDIIDVSETTVKNGRTKGQQMAFVTLAFGMNSYRCTFFPQDWNRFKHLIEGGTMMVQGKKDTWRGTVSVKVDLAIDIPTWVENVQEEEMAVAS